MAAISRDEMMADIFDGFMAAESIFHTAKGSGDDLRMVSKVAHEIEGKPRIKADIRTQIRTQSYLSRLDELILHYA